MTDSESNGGRDARPRRQVRREGLPGWLRVIIRIVLTLLGLVASAAVAAVLLIGIALAVSYPNLPEIDSLTDYRPKLPMRVFSADGVLLGEFGEERRNFVPIQQIPKVMQDAVLAAEDAKFYKHSGVNYVSVIRAGLAQFRRGAERPGRFDDHDAGRAQFLSVDRENIYSQDLRDVALAQDREPAHEGADSRGLHESHRARPARVWFRVGQRNLFRQAAEGHHGRRGGDACRAAEGAFGEQPDRQSRAGDDPPALHHRAHARQRIHHPGAARRGAEAGPQVPRADRGRRARRVRRRSGAPDDLQPVRRRGLHARPERLPDVERGRADARVPRAAQGDHGVREAPGLPWPGGLHRPSRRQERARRAHLRGAAGLSGQRRAARRGRHRSVAEEGRRDAAERRRWRR